MLDNINNIAALQITGCVPIGVCGLSGDFPTTSTGTTELTGGTLRITKFSVPGTISVSVLKFLSVPGDAGPLLGVTMGLYAATYLKDGVVTPTNHPTQRLAVVGAGSGKFVRGDDGWWSARLPGNISLGNGTYYIAHVFDTRSRAWKAPRATRPSQAWHGQAGLPPNMVMNWSAWETGGGVPLAAEWDR